MSCLSSLGDEMVFETYMGIPIYKSHAEQEAVNSAVSPQREIFGQLPT